MTTKGYTDAERWAIIRAAGLYENQWTLVQMIEFPDRNPDSLKKMVRANAAWRPVTGTEKLELRIETEPEAVASEILDWIASRQNSRARLPEVLAGDAPTVVDPEPVEPMDPEARDLARAALTIRRLKDENAELRKRATATEREGVLFELARTEIEEHQTPLVVRPRTERSKREARVDEDLVLVLSDAHADKVILPERVLGFEDYAFPVFCRRAVRYVDTIGDWTQRHLRDHSFGRAWVFLLGDMIEGVIHGAQKHTSFKNCMKAALAVGDVLALMLMDLADIFPSLHVVAVPGNHPRHGKRVDWRGPHENFDYLVASQAATRLQGYVDEGRITFDAPNAWMAVVDVRGWNWMLSHGHEVKSWNGIPFYGIERRTRRMQALFSARDLKLHYQAMGHFHQSTQLPTPVGETFMNGAWFWADEYSLDALGAAGRPFQWMMGVHEKRGVSWRLPIQVAAPEGPEDLSADCRYDQRILSDLAAADRRAAGGIPIIGAATAGE